MRFKAQFLMALLLSLSAAFAYADPPARAGRLNYLHGTVSFAPATAPETWAVAVLNRPLTSGDRLWTARDGYAELHVGSTAVRLAPNTSLDILVLDDDTLQLRLAQGDVNIRLREVGGDAIEVDTPNAAVLLEEPGSYRITASAGDETTNVLVHSGRAQLLAQQSAISLLTRQHVTLRGANGIPSEIVAANRDAFDQWSAELDRREDEVAAARYVSPHMTGYEDLDAYGTWRTLPEYGAVWVPSVAAGWAPYRHGHWVWVEPWGWTWIDDAPWGFAPFHYGRWVWHGYWAWAPGTRIARPVYAPALVAFVGGATWSVSIGAGPAVGWFPLGWREPFFPWYRTSPSYVRQVNITHVKNITIYNNVTRINYANQALPQAVTVVPREAFVAARPVARSRLRIPSGHATRAPLLRGTPAEPVPSSLVARRADARPPESAMRREVLGTRAAPRPRRSAQDRVLPSPGERGEVPGSSGTPAEPRVRVIERQRSGVERRASKSPRAAEAARENVRKEPPVRTPRAQSVPAPQPRSQPQAEGERRSPGSSSDQGADSGTRKAPQPARAVPRTQPHPREAREGRVERRPVPRPDRAQRTEQPPRSQRPAHESVPRAQGTQPPQAANRQGPRQAQPRAQAPRPEARGPQHAPPPRAGGRPKREERNRRD